MSVKPLAKRVLGLSPSPTLAITARAGAMRAQGLDVISFAAGEPDFDTPSVICDAAESAMRGGFTKYTSGRGIKELRDVIADKLVRENGLSVTGDEVLITCGAKHALINSILAIVDPGDEVIILAPFWTTYEEQVSAAGGVPVLVHCAVENGFVPDPNAISAAITDRTKAIMLCSPNNPTGSVWPREVMIEIGHICVKHGLWVISDEVYEKLIYEGEHVSPASLSPELGEQTITIGSCSKSFAMTGWRIGFMAGSKRAIDAMACVQDTISHPTSFAQKAAVTAFQMGDATMDAMREEYRARRDMMHRLTNDIPGVSAYLPPGAFYIFADFSKLIGDRFSNDQELAEYLLQQGHVAVIPGTFFSAPGYLRFSYAASREDIQRGMARVSEVLQTLHA